MDLQNISSTFSPKSDLLLSEIMKKNNLDGNDIAEIILTKITMLYSREEISEKETVDFIQKEVKVSQQVAEQIAEKIKNNLIPTLWDKMPKEERDALLRKREGAPLPVTKKPDFPNVEENEKFLNKNKPPITSKEPLDTTQDDNIKKPIKKFQTPEKESYSEDNSKIPKKSAQPKMPKSDGPDKYREPVE